MDPIVRDILRDHLKAAIRNAASQENWAAKASEYAVEAAERAKTASDAVVEAHNRVLVLQNALGEQDYEQSAHVGQDLLDKMAAREAQVDREKAEMAIDQAAFAEAVR